jgi:hypothetical protein
MVPFIGFIIEKASTLIRFIHTHSKRTIDRLYTFPFCVSVKTNDDARECGELFQFHPELDFRFPFRLAGAARRDRRVGSGSEKVQSTGSGSEKV